VETGNPSACATVIWIVRKTEIELCDLYLSVIKSECITQLIINPFVRTRTRLISNLHVTLFISIIAVLYFVGILNGL
jgi:hypothetical protein